MSPGPLRRTQKLTIIAKDKSVKVGVDGHILRAKVEIPAEELAPGPRGYRVQVIDYDSSSGLLYPPLEYRTLADGTYNDPFDDEPDVVLLGDPEFHAQNVYAIVMRVLARFEYALGRRVSWSFGGHQLQVAPHAFLEANAFYSKDDRSLLFGYFPDGEEEASAPAENTGDEPESDSVSGKKPRFRFQNMVFTCLSHDVVAHETTHALLDGLRPRYTDPSSPEQAGFHEGFSDVVALLSIFSLPEVVRPALDHQNAGSEKIDGVGNSQVISSQHLTAEALRESLLFAIGNEIGRGLAKRDEPLRRSIALEPGKDYTQDPAFLEPHRRGELLVAAMMNAFLEVWIARLQDLYPKDATKDSRGDAAPATAATKDAEYLLDRKRVVEEGADIADQLLTMSIRAIDYCPPTDLQFCDFLSAILTADRELRPEDSKFHFRDALRRSFLGYGIAPTSKGDGTEAGVWEPPEGVVSYLRVHFEPMRTDKDEMFRFVWENRVALGLDKDAYTHVLSVRPAVRVNPEDGFVLRETVAEYHQILNVAASELKHLGIKKPAEMPSDQQVTLYGGGVLIFDDFARLKFHIRNRLLNPERQTQRLKYLWQFGRFQELQILEREARRDNTFARMHLRRFELGASVPGGVNDDEFF